jgi:hypothetical protein
MRSSALAACGPQRFTGPLSEEVMRWVIALTSSARPIHGQY